MPLVTSCSATAAASCSSMLGAGREKEEEEEEDREAASMKEESKVPVHEEFTYVCGAATQVLKCGPWKDLSKHESNPRLLFLVIPGNPGLVYYYRTFIQTLYSGLKQQYPVWVVSHAGHCKVPYGMKMTEEMDVCEPDNVFGLDGQIEHKLNFLQKNVPKDMKLVLIGHSVGCYIALEIMKLAPELQILRTVQLFPTIERMAQSPQGKIMTPLLCQLRYVVYMPLYLLTLLPERVKSFFVRFVLRQSCSDEPSLTATVDMINMDCIANAMYMASEEMRKIIDRDSSTISQHLKKLTFYYGATDPWCPVEYYEAMKMEFPEGDIRLCEKGFRHAFVLETAKEMAEMVIDWVQDDLARL